MKTWAEGELLSASDLNSNFTEAARLPRVGYGNSYSPTISPGALATSDTSQRTVAAIDMGVTDFGRLISVQGKLDADVTSAPIILIVSLTRIPSGTAVGTTFNPTTGTVVMQTRIHISAAANTYLPLYHGEFLPPNTTNSKYVFSAYRTSGAADSINGSGLSVAGTWVETASTNEFAALGGVIS